MDLRQGRIAEPSGHRGAASYQRNLARKYVRPRFARCPETKSFDMGGVAIKLALLDGVVAQLVEHHNGIVGVRGSNPLGSTISNIVQKHLTCSEWREKFQPVNQRVF